MSNFYSAGKAAMTSSKDDWETPAQLFEQLDREYHFTLSCGHTVVVDGDFQPCYCDECGCRVVSDDD